MSAPHNLNINSYSLKELFALFDMTDLTTISVEDMKRAKKKVLMTHPDKSQLPADYFLFYKKAFDVVMRFYENQTKQNQKIPTEPTAYSLPAGDDKRQTNQIRGVIDKMSRDDFQRKFNQLFDDNMASKPDAARNEWFTNHEPVHTVDDAGAINPKNMGAVFDRIKETQHSMVSYRGEVRTLNHGGGGGGANLYDDDEAAADGGGDMYVTSDPFSKLKYDDLRKVHKDQTVFMVSERDLEKVPQYTSVDHYARERGGQNLAPLEKAEAERVLADQNKQYREYIRQKEYQAELKTQQNTEKNKSIMSNFLRLRF